MSTEHIDQSFLVSDGVNYSYFCKFDELKDVVARSKKTTKTTFPTIKNSCYHPTDDNESSSLLRSKSEERD